MSRRNFSMTFFSQEENTRCSSRAVLLAGLVAALAVLLMAPIARADVDWGIESVGASLSTTEAGRHPDLITEIQFKGEPSGPTADVRDLSVELPPGLSANPQNFPECSFLTFMKSIPPGEPCSQETQVGLVEVRFGNVERTLREPLYNLSAPEDELARLGFLGLLYPIFLEVDLRSGSDYGISVHSQGIQDVLRILSIKTKTWGVPADPIHNSERLTPFEAAICGAPLCTKAIFEGYEGPFERSSALSPVPFMTNPANCGPLEVGFKVVTYQHPDEVQSASASAGEITDCDKVPFNPSLSLATTSRRAGAPTGLEAILKMPQNEAVNTVNASPLRSATVALPQGMTVNSSAADGLQGCSAGQAGFATDGPAQCPDQSKLGSATFVSPNLKRPIQGGIFLRTPESGHLFRFWLVSNELGVDLKLPAEVELDQKTGRLTTVIQDSPNLPAEEVVLRLNGGPRAPLRNPLTCGTFDATYELGPWSGNPPVAGVVPIAIDQGCDSGGFSPGLAAGAINPVAGSFSPFVFDVTREDGEQNIAKIDVTLPEGLTAKLAGVELCPDEAAVSGACPASSQIGVVKAATGAGTEPLWIPQPGKDPTAVYLGGPYKGAPYSVVAKVPAQAGPFDLGVVSVRSSVSVDPETAQVTVRSDDLPQILQGVPIDYRHVRVEVNRDRFTLNPTSCAEESVHASILSSGGLTAEASDRFQASECARLTFAPKLSLRLKGGTRRATHPQLRAVLRAKPGQANIRRVSVALPHSEFLEQAHIGTVCTRVQFAAEACPKDSIYGRASVTTPLLDHPLRGPVYLRSSNHELPDLVIDLKGQLRITLAGRIDSVNGGIRTTFASAPDAPIRKFVLNMKGGKKGLLVNSRNLCLAPSYATVKMDGQNGKISDVKPRLTNDC
jgi:hypothetical protein